MSKDKLMKSLDRVLAKHAATRMNGNIASTLTVTTKTEALNTTFRNLYDLGYKLADVHNLQERHIEALCRHWYEKEIALSTMYSRLSNLRHLAEWMGKPGFVKSLPYYLKDVDPAKLVLKKTAEKSKSWTENQVDVEQKIREADFQDHRFGLMLRMILAFGLRRLEVLKLEPWKADKESYLEIRFAKNGRPRNIPIETPEQRQVLDYVKSFIRKSDHLGWSMRADGSAANFEYSTSRYNTMMRQIGITREMSNCTGHGLRAQYAENSALILSLIPATLGGHKQQMDKETLDLKRSQVSELLGHSRKSITASYYGSFGRKHHPQGEFKLTHQLKEWCQAGDFIENVEITTTRIHECLLLVAELALEDIPVSYQQVHTLWRRHSKRHAREWITPGEKGNVAALVAAAVMLKKEEEEKEVPAL